jgi:cytoskeletal protein RodZ
MTSVGATLRSARERQGRALAEIAEELCLTQRYLRAVEENDLKSLPGTFFYKNFVRQYAAVLGVDPAQLRSGMEALTAAEDVPASPVNAPTPLVTATNRRYYSGRSLGTSVAGLVGVLVACSAFYAWWQKPARAVTNSAVKQTAVQKTPVQKTSAATPAVEAAPVQDVVTTGVTSNVVISSDDAAGVNRVALNLSATEKTWLSVTSGGRQIFSGVLEPSQTKILTGLEMAQMKVGNAGGIEVLWNGKSIGPIGPRGTVRVVVFTPDNFEILSSDPPAPAESL